MNKLRVMIVDDDDETRATLLDYITNGLGAQVVALADVKSAVTAIEIFKPDLILTDYTMPNASGIDLIKAVKPILPHSSIVLMTACNKIETAVEAMKLGASDFISKPFNLYQIDLIAKAVVAARDSIKSLEQVETDYIESVIAQCGSVREAATKLGINPSTIWRKRKNKAA